jgi:hypothetical protein
MAQFEDDLWEVERKHPFLTADRHPDSAEKTTIIEQTPHPGPSNFGIEHAFGLLFGLGAIVGVIYVVLHFVAKYW